MLTASLLVLNLRKHNGKSSVKKKCHCCRSVRISSKVQSRAFVHHGARTRMAIII